MWPIRKNTRTCIWYYTATLRLTTSFVCKCFSKKTFQKQSVLHKGIVPATFIWQIVSERHFIITLNLEAYFIPFFTSFNLEIYFESATFPFRGIFLQIAYYLTHCVWERGQHCCYNISIYNLWKHIISHIVSWIVSVVQQKIWNTYEKYLLISEYNYSSKTLFVRNK